MATGWARRLLMMAVVLAALAVPAAQADPVFDLVDKVNEANDVVQAGTFSATAVIEVNPDNTMRVTLDDVVIVTENAPDVRPSLDPGVNHLGPFIRRFTGLAHLGTLDADCIPLATAQLPCGALRSGVVGCAWRVDCGPPVPSTLISPPNPFNDHPALMPLTCGASGRNSFWHVRWEQFVQWEVALTCSSDPNGIGFVLYEACPVVADTIIDRSRVTVHLAGPLAEDC